MAEERRQKERLEKYCVRAFKSGDKLMAEQLLPRIPAITTTFDLPGFVVCSMVTLLHLAAYWGWGNVVTELVSVYHCAANSKDSGGNIPLHYAAYNGHLEVVKYFTAQLQCDPMEKNTAGRTPLQFACRNGHFNVVQYLIGEEHCNPSVENNGGWTPLHYACSNGHLNIVQYLLSTGRVNPLAENEFGHTALYYASDKYDIIKLFEPLEECRTALKDDRTC